MAATGVRLLALDGGGVRGLSALMILQQLMEKIDPDSPPRPCDCFDMIGGTSTGGLIAIMLGRLKMTVAECITAYTLLSDEVFIKRRHRFTITGRVQGRFDSDKLEQAIKRVIAERGLGKDELLKDDDGPCKVFVCATSKETSDTVCLRSYRSDRSSNIRLAGTTIWQACRATAAATTFFEPITIGSFGETFVDGALGANNPVNQLWSECRDVFGARPVQCLVSIGAGVPPLHTVGDSLIGIIETLQKLATETEKTAEIFHRAHDKEYYHRFNVSHGLENVGLEEAGKKNVIVAATVRYIESQAVFEKFDACVKALKGGQNHSPPDPDPPPRQYHLPFYKNQNFVGRENELEQLQTWLFKDECRIVALHGLGGVGMTQVANALAHWTKDNKKDYSVFWVPAISEPDFEKALSVIASELGIQPESDKRDVWTLVCDHLSSKAAGKWLLVIDNLDDDRLTRLQGCFPRSDSGRTLVTTRKKMISDAVAQKALLLSAFDLPRAKQLATKMLDSSLLADDASLDALLKELECFPLAITQAMAYIRLNNRPIRQYLELLRKTEKDKIDLLSYELPGSTRYAVEAQHTVATTWFTLFSRLQGQNPKAVELLEFLSQIQPKAIPKSLLPRLGSDAELSIAVSCLCDYSFVSWQGDNVFNMHSLVHMAARSWVEKSGRQKEVIRDALQQMCRVFPEYDHDTRDIWRAYLPHAMYMFHEGKALDSEDAFELYLRVGYCLQRDGRTKEALQCFRHCNEWACRSFPEDHPRRLSSQHFLAGGCEADDNHQEAISLYEHVVRIREQTLPETDHDRLSSQNNLANIYQATGEFSKAIPLLEHVVRVRQKLPENHASRLTSEGNLGLAYSKDGQTSKAIPLLEHVCGIYEKALPEDNPVRLNAQNNLALAYNTDGQISKAIPLYEHVFRIYEQTLPEWHPDRLASQNNLACAYQDDGQISKAISLLEDVVRIVEAIFPEDNSHRLISQFSLAAAYKANKQFSDAISLFEHIAHVYESLAEDNHNRLTLQSSIADALWENGDRTRAIELMRRTVGRWKSPNIVSRQAEASLRRMEEEFTGR